MMRLSNGRGDPEPFCDRCGRSTAGRWRFEVDGIMLCEYCTEKHLEKMEKHRNGR